MSAVCEHLDYDDYFEKCLDCGLTLEQVHETECVPVGFVIDTETDEVPACARCGLQFG